VLSSLRTDKETKFHEPTKMPVILTYNEKENETLKYGI